MDITIETFLERHAEDMKRFKAFYEKERERDPAWAPAEMPESEWFEQFIVFLNLDEY